MRTRARTKNAEFTTPEENNGFRFNSDRFVMREGLTNKDREVCPSQNLSPVLVQVQVQVFSHTHAPTSGTKQPPFGSRPVRWVSTQLPLVIVVSGLEIALSTGNAKETPLPPR
ncbi:hypothetical protein BC829DRAFT_421851 [Chytridium lagenaria]|nr:hypothetical protein BC829DRAFT_421851 [Chytridium lagenaria]